MSARNKLENKYTRKATRVFAKSPHGERPVSQLPKEVFIAVLADPKRMKLNGRYRRKLQRVRGTIVPSNPEPPKHFAVKAAIKLTKLTLAQLFRRQAQAARNASTCKHLIAELSPGSIFAETLKSRQTAHLSFLRQVNAEIKSRNHQSK